MPSSVPSPHSAAFTLNPALDADAIADAFARQGHVRIAPFLDEGSAKALHALLRGRQDWRQLINHAKGVFELDRSVRAGMTAQQCTALDEAVYAQARDGFQFRYESIGVPDEAEKRSASDDPLVAFVAWLSQGAPRAFLRKVSGCDDIAFADGQATAYSPGDFLTGHDDAVAGKQRVAAYIMGLTPIWRLEWGGLLMLHGQDDANVTGLVPGFNTLVLLSVPQMHSVSEVTRAAVYRRYSITGWLRRSG